MWISRPLFIISNHGLIGELGDRSCEPVGAKVTFDALKRPRCYLVWPADVTLLLRLLDFVSAIL